MQKRYTTKEIYYIAEIGQNHNGSLELAKKMVDSLKGSEVKAIKTAKRDTSIYLDFPYNNEHSYGKTYREHREALELSEYDFIELKKYVEKSGFDFISSFTDLKSLRFLNEIGAGLKLASCVNDREDILKELAQIGKPVIASTGMADIKTVLNISNVLRNIDLTLLQCTSAYPCELKNVNLSQIKPLSIMCNNVGFSNHTTENRVDLYAYIMGADVIERHYTLDKKSKGTDHGISATREDIDEVFKMINEFKIINGTPIKKVLKCEHSAMIKLRSASI